MPLTIAVPALAIPFIIFVRYEEPIVRFIKKIKIPRFVLALLAAAPLIVFEEHVNCGAYACANVILPPTLWFLLGFELFAFILMRVLRIRSLLFQTFLASIAGCAFELLLGAAYVEFQELARTNLPGFILIILWVTFSYAFILYLPLAVAQKDYAPA